MTMRLKLYTLDYETETLYPVVHIFPFDIYSL